MQIIHKKIRSIVGVSCALFLCALSGVASADIIDDIVLKTDAHGEVDATIKFTVPIQKLRYFPRLKSQFLTVYFNILENVSRDQWQDYESHRSPPSDLIRGFTITTRDLNTGPKIEIQFNRPSEFSLTAGRDSRSLLIHIKPDKPLQDKESKSVRESPGAASLPPAVASSAVAVTALPKTATSVLPGTPFPETTKPVAVPAPGQLGGKDGLPPFPKIEQDIADTQATEAAQATEATGDTQAVPEATLSDQIKKANSDAAVLMAKGRDALLAGEMFLAIEAFNNALKLPPNKYSQDAQLWIGIAREKSGQQAKARSEYDSYLKLYPNGTSTKWVKDRLAKLEAIQPSASVSASSMQQPAAVKAQNKNFNTTEYGSYSMYYYHGASHTDTITTVGAVQSPSSLTVTDQSSMISNVSMTARSYNDEYDNRLVLQDFYAANFLPGQQNKNRLNAAFFELKNRISDYSARIGRQSAMGGGVLGRFDGMTAGYGFLPNLRADAVAGQLSDYEVGDKPKFYGTSMDFGIRNPIGGSLYLINQTVGGIADRKAVGGNLRYFDQRKTAIAMVDYDTQFRALNIVTVQGTLNGGSGNDYNFLLDRRKSPSLSIRNSVNGAFGTMVQTDALGNPVLDTNGNPIQINFIPTVSSLLQNGFTQADLIALAKQRTATSNIAQVGVTNHIREKWQIGTDLTVSETSGMPQSGHLNSDGTTGTEGFVAASASTGSTWTISGRLIGNDVISSRDVSMFNVSYTRSHLLNGTTLLLNNHAYIRELWTLDTTMRMYWQTDNTGGKETIIAPTLKLGYQIKTNITLESEGGLERTDSKPSTLQTSKTLRKYFTLGFRWDF